ncbi:hypothetical protein D3C83_201180 [compost metagenome]
MKYWPPGSITQTMRSPIWNALPAGTVCVSSPGISPKLQTDAASASSDPAPCMMSHASVLTPMSAIVT